MDNSKENKDPVDARVVGYWIAAGYLFGAAVASILVMWGVLVFVVPKFSEIFEDFDTELPRITAVVISVSWFLRHPAGLALFAVLIGGIVALFICVRHHLVRFGLPLILFAVTCVGVAVIVLALYLPLVRLIQSMT